jgi:hypothetical protein
MSPKITTAATGKGHGSRTTWRSAKALSTISGTLTSASASSSALRTRRGFSSSLLSRSARRGF